MLFRSAEIRKWLRYKLDVHSYYLGSGQGSTRLLDRLRRAVKSKTRKPKKQKSEGAPRPRKQPGILDAIRTEKAISDTTMPKLKAAVDAFAKSFA